MASSEQQGQVESLSPFEIELIQRVHSHFPNSEPTKFHFFYHTASPFSNFHPCHFVENGIQFNTSEQYMMYQKAKLFQDNETAEAILQAQTPAACKALGRGVSNFDQETWRENRTLIVSNALYLKFTQNDNLKRELLKHSGSLFVEAAANDTIWGVGLSKSDPLIANRSTWKGFNLLGYILTDILHRIHCPTG